MKPSVGLAHQIVIRVIGRAQHSNKFCMPVIYEGKLIGQK